MVPLVNMGIYKVCHCLELYGNICSMLHFNHSTNMSSFSFWEYKIQHKNNKIYLTNISVLLILYSIFCVPRSLLDQRHLLLPCSLLLLPSNYTIPTASKLFPIWPPPLPASWVVSTKWNTQGKADQRQTTNSGSLVPSNYVQPSNCIKSVCHLTHSLPVHKKMRQRLKNNYQQPQKQ